jgi:hypothetical protein
MRRKIALALAVLTTLAAATVAAQSKHASSAWTPPRTADGQPNLQGIWTNATITPFERPPALRDKAFLTDAEAEQLERRAATIREDDGPPRAGDVGSYNQLWFD